MPDPESKIVFDPYWPPPIAGAILVVSETFTFRNGDRTPIIVNYRSPIQRASAPTRQELLFRVTAERKSMNIKALVALLDHGYSVGDFMGHRAAFQWMDAMTRPVGPGGVLPDTILPPTALGQ